MMAGFSAGVGYFGLSALSKFDDFMTEAMAIFRDGNVEVREELERTLMSVSRGTMTGPADLAQAYRELAAAGYQASEAVEMLSTVERFSAMNHMTPEHTARDLTRLMRTLGLRTDDALETANNFRHLGDVITAVGIRSQVPIEQFVHGLERISPTMRMLKKDITEGSALLAAFTAHMGHPVLAATATNQVMQNLGRLFVRSDVPPDILRGGIQAGRHSGFQSVPEHQLHPIHGPAIRSVQMATQTWRELGIEVFDASGNMRHFSELMVEIDERFSQMSQHDIFARLIRLGFQRNVAQSITALLGSSQAMNEFYEVAKKADGTLERLYSERMRSFGSQLKILRAELERVAIEIGRVLIPYLLMLNQLVIQGSAAWGELPSAAKQVIATLIGIVLASQLLRIAITFLLPAIMSIAQLLYGLTGIPLVKWLYNVTIASYGFAKSILGMLVSLLLFIPYLIGSGINMLIVAGQYAFAAISMAYSDLMVMGFNKGLALTFAILDFVTLGYGISLLLTAGQLYDFSIATLAASGITGVFAQMLAFANIGSVGLLSVIMFGISAIYGWIITVIKGIFTTQTWASTMAELATIMLVLDFITLGLVGVITHLFMKTVAYIGAVGVWTLAFSLLDFVTFGLISAMTVLLLKMVNYILTTTIGAFAAKFLAFTFSILSLSSFGLAISLGFVATIIATLTGLILLLAAVSLLGAVALIGLALALVPIGIFVGWIAIIGVLALLIAVVNRAIEAVGLFDLSWDKVSEGVSTFFWNAIGLMYNFRQNVTALGTWFVAFWNNLVRVNFTEVFAQAAIDFLYNLLITLGAFIDMVFRLFRSILFGWAETMRSLDGGVRNYFNHLRFNPFRNTHIEIPPLELNVHVPTDVRTMLQNIPRQLTQLGRPQVAPMDNLAKVGEVFREIALNRFIIDANIQHDPNEALRVQAPGIEARQDIQIDLLDRLVNRRAPVVGN